ncbi:MAG TPA: cyclase family protein [Jiangellaceae bacterium]
MCAPVATAQHHHHHPDRTGSDVADHGTFVTRRGMLRASAALAGGAAIVAAGSATPATAFPKRSRRTADLTHRLVRTFPSFFGPQVVFDEVVNDFSTSGFFSKRWTFEEHIGTHIDTPGHFDEGNSLVDQIGPENLVAPVVVIDITAKAAEDPNAVVTPDDLVAFERRHGRIPERALVCMNSGWAAKVDDGDAFRGGAGFPDLNFPGFSIDATDWLVANRDPVGIGLDTMSLDPGNSADFAVHVEFLASGRYGIESMANLDRIPPRGALAFVGPVPWEDGSGSPCRVIAAW